MTLIDPVELHVVQARTAHPGLIAVQGDARRLDQADCSADVVLLPGPMYHLVERSDRIAALRETLRVLRPSGVVFVAAISRWVALWDVLLRVDVLHEPAIGDLVEEARNDPPRPEAILRAARLVEEKHRCWGPRVTFWPWPVLPEGAAPVA